MQSILVLKQLYISSDCLLQAITGILTTCLALSYGISQKSCFFHLEDIESKHYLDTGSSSLHMAARITIIIFPQEKLYIGTHAT